MFGIRHIKSQPTMHLMQYRNGQMVRSGAGESFFYYSPLSTVIAIPVASIDAPFMFELITGDFQSVTVQGLVSYRISDAERMAGLLDFSLDASGKHYASEDPEKLNRRVVTQVEIAIQRFVQVRELTQVLTAASDVARTAQGILSEESELTSLGLEIRSVSIQAIKPTPDIARALEAEAREANLKAADDAVYARRIAAVANEQSIREKELDTEIAVQDKQKQIEQAKMEIKATVAQKRNELQSQQMTADIELEQSRKTLVASQADNTRTQAEAEAYRLDATMRVFDGADPKTIQALASVGMEPGQLIAQAFGGIADNASKIGQLNMSPELLQQLMGQPAERPVHHQAESERQDKRGKRHERQ